MQEQKNSTTPPNADESVNYLAYLTLMPLPQPPTPAKLSPLHRMSLEKKLQQLFAEERAHLEAEMQQLLAESQARTEEAVARLLLAEQGYTTAQEQRKLNRLGDVRFHATLSLDGVTPKNHITEIRFLNTQSNAPEDAADLSEAEDGSVLCWTEGTVQYIAGEGGVAAGSSCANLFRGYAHVTAIRFGGNFDTSDVKYMYYMFSGCSALTEVDFSGWNTAKVTDMAHMFYNCKALPRLDLSGWNTASVRDMNGMFSGCSALTEVELSQWDTSNVQDMGHMFNGCRALAQLNLSHWNTTWVTNMGYMFSGCSSLRSRPFRLDTSHADTTLMYMGTSLK